MPPNGMYGSVNSQIYFDFPQLLQSPVSYMRLTIINKISCILLCEYSLQRRALRPGYALRTWLPVILDQSLEIDHFLIFLIAPIHWQFKQFNSSLPLSHLYHSWWLQPLQEWSIQPVGILSSCLPPFQRSFFLYTAFCSSPFSMTSS